jgi:hypothetical protein
MGKKVYKMTEDQVASILGKKKESTIAEIPAPGLQLSTEGEKKKTKYKITEDQLKRIFNELGSKAVDEMDNYNYPMGSDTPDAPWNRDDSDNTRAGETVDGNYVAVANSKYDFILKDKQNTQLYYTMTDFWDDIYDDLLSVESVIKRLDFSTKEKAIDRMEDLEGDINEASEDYVVSAIYEHELDCGKNNQEKLILKQAWEKDWESPERNWIKVKEESCSL